MTLETTIPIPVTTALLAQAIPGEPCQCLVALALRQATGHRWHVDMAQAYDITHTPYTITWRLPLAIRRLVHRFDTWPRRELINLVGTVIQIPRRLKEHTPCVTPM